MELPEINDRIRQLIDLYSNGSVKKFAENLPNVSQQRLNRLFNVDTRTGKYPIATTDIIVDITEMFVEISAEWLLTGKGEKFKTKTTEIPVVENDRKDDRENDRKPKLQKTRSSKDEYPTESPVSIASDLIGSHMTDTSKMTVIPIVDIAAAAGGAGEYNADYLTPEDSIVMPPQMVRRGVHHCVKIKGDSMAPTMQDGGYIIVRLLDRAEWVDVKNDYVYVVADREGRTYIKRLRNRLREHGFIVCTSDNPDKNAYPNFNLEEDEIHSILFVEWYLSAKMPNIHATYYDQVQQLRDDMDDIKDFLARQFKKPIKGS